jgi:hypothetical protein
MIIYIKDFKDSNKNTYLSQILFGKYQDINQHSKIRNISTYQQRTGRERNQKIYPIHNSIKNFWNKLRIRRTSTMNTI